MRWLSVILMALAPLPLAAGEIKVRPGGLAAALMRAEPGDVLVLAPGDYAGPVVLDRPLVLDGGRKAHIDGGGNGSVITVTAENVTVRGLTITGSGDSHETIDSGVQLTKTAHGAVVEDNVLTGNLYGVDIHGARNARVSGNIIEGQRHDKMNRRGNGVYVWNAPGAQVTGNDIRWGRDGIFSTASRDNVFNNNIFRDLRFAVHYMYTNDSEVAGNVSLGNHLGFALMFSNKITVRGNLSLGDRGHGLMLNYANNADVVGNLVRGGAEKCTFIYNAHKNLIAGNRFEGCGIGVHFTAGSERNALTGNAFIGNRTQVKYVGSRHVEWSLDGRGNYWSDHPAFDLNGDGIADSPFRPNDLMDHILWSQPSAALLTGSPAVQLIRWSQASFPATLPGGVLDSHPLTRPVEIDVPAKIAALEAALPGWNMKGQTDDEFDPLRGH